MLVNTALFLMQAIDTVVDVLSGDLILLGDQISNTTELAWGQVSFSS